MDDAYFDLETEVYNVPALCFPHIDGLVLPENAPPDRLVTNHVIPMHLTTLNGPDSESVNQQNVGFLMTRKKQVYGGQVLMRPASTLPKLQLEGYIDTPSEIVNNEYYVPQVYTLDALGIQNRYTYAEIIAMILEGRANIKASGAWGRLDFLWFRDPWGRVYNNPRVLAFTAQYVEGIPERTSFTMTLLVTGKREPLDTQEGGILDSQDGGIESVAMDTQSDEGLEGLV